MIPHISGCARGSRGLPRRANRRKRPPGGGSVATRLTHAVSTCPSNSHAMGKICARLKLVHARNAADGPHANLVHAFHSTTLHAGRAGETERPPSLKLQYRNSKGHPRVNVSGLVAEASTALLDPISSGCRTSSKHGLRRCDTSGAICCSGVRGDRSDYSGGRGPSLR